MDDKKRHLLSINLEDYFQVAPLRQVIPKHHWSRFSLRVEQNTLAALDLLDRFNAKATFFALGWLAERRPDMIAEIVRRGHEVASKGYQHAKFAQLSQAEFETDFLRARDVIETASGQAVLGYRIAEGSLPTNDLAPFEFLARQGIRYDSSVRPFGTGFVGKPNWRRIQKVSGADWSLTEVPLSSQSLFGIPVPMTGGNYLRQEPEAVFNARLARYLKTSDAPWHFYFHIWELDPEQPRISAISTLARLRQYRNIERMPERLATYLRDHDFHGIAAHLDLVPQAVAPRTAPLAAKVETPVRVVGANRKHATIVVPCYNEEATLPYLDGTLVSLAEQNRATLKLSYVFVDDGSKDRTWDVLNELFSRRADCTLIRHRQNRGIATATMTGIHAARDEIVCGIDCDCSFDPHELSNMIPLLTDDVDMVQASPYHRDGGVTNVPAWRLALSRNLSRIYRMVLRHKFASYTACFRVYRRDSIARIRLDDEGFLGIAEMFIRLDRGGARIFEFPAVLESRLLGVSKMKTLKVIRAHLGMLARLAFGRLDDATEPPRPQTPPAKPNFITTDK